MQNDEAVSNFRHQSWKPSRVRALLFSVLRFLYVIGIYGLPLVAVMAIFSISGALWYRGIALLLAPLLYSLLLVVVAGALSVPHQHAIIPGHFPRRVDHPMYFHRRLYGVCWTALYYCTPVYGLCLTLPWMKWLAFRLFGYRGSMDFTVYPDTWIRDLPLLDFGPGVYVSNRTTLGTNMVLPDHQILVGAIRLGEGALVGHLSLIGPGVTVGPHTEIGVLAGIGVNTSIGQHTLVGPQSLIGHEVRIGEHVHIGGGSVIDTRSTIPDGTRMPPASIVSHEPMHSSPPDEADAPRSPSPTPLLVGGDAQTVSTRDAALGLERGE